MIVKLKIKLLKYVPALKGIMIINAQLIFIENALSTLLIHHSMKDAIRKIHHFIYIL